MANCTSISTPVLNDRLYLLPHAKLCASLSSLSSRTLFFTFSCGGSLFPPKPLLCRAASAPDTQTLSKSAIQRISEKLRSLGYVEDGEDKRTPPPPPDTGDSPGYSPGEIFVPLPTQLPKYRVGHTLDPSWSAPENPVPLPGAGKTIQKYHKLRLGAMKEKIAERGQKKKESVVPTLAELTLPKSELRRLKTLGIGLEKKLKVGKAGITEGIVNGIHERWRRNEVVKIRCEDICQMNMKRTHDILERKTGGLVVWRSGSNIVLYRGTNYKYPYFSSTDGILVNGTASGASSEEMQSDLNRQERGGEASTSPPLVRGVGTPDIVRFRLPGEAQLTDEADRLLEGLGPRFIDWWGYDPLPVDADLLPAVVPGYRKPFRLLPYGVKPILTNDEMTILKRLGRPLPCHFALGRNRKLQGLAVAVMNLWEKCEIAKIAIKRGVQNTNSELMAEELKQLTGGVLLSRDKEFLVFYRGKDFLPASVSLALEERRKSVLDGERHSNVKASTAANSNDKIQAIPRDENNDAESKRSQIVPERRLLISKEKSVENTSARLSKALAKKASAEKLLADLQKEETLKEAEIDKEGITEEERYMLRKVGLRMHAFLLIGRRGVFDGTVENMHLHWKYRELVKIITGGKNIQEVYGVARSLEAESGGILVAVERVSKGYAIIVYRGKNYTRPAVLRPRSLLSKREALKRSIEAQRRESLKLHVLKLSQNIDQLKLQLAKGKDSNKLRLGRDLRPEPVKEQVVTKVQTAKNEMAGSSPGICFSEHPSSQQDKEQEATNFLSAENEMEVANPEACLSENSSNQLNLSEASTASAITTAEARLDDANSVWSVAASPETKPDTSVDEAKMSTSITRSSRAEGLSNKERLLLRKQALTQKKRPLFAIGKSNDLTGLAEAIRNHFRKHPLAIVNVKGRAKGTSVQEVVLKLEQATDGVLVSREPSKVILYRGWGAEKGTYNGDRKPPSERRPADVVSQELLSAIRLECGLQS